MLSPFCLSASSGRGAGGDTLGHVGQGITEDRQGGDALAEIVGIDLVEGVGFGVVPIEIVGAGGAFGEAGNAIADERIDVFARRRR